MRNLYDRYVLPKLINSAMQQKPIMRIREEMVPLARGKVLEIGCGSGLNFPFYSPDAEHIVAIDPSPELTNFAAQRQSQAPVPVDLQTGTALNIPCDNNAFDSLVLTWTLCSISDPYLALREFRRVLKPGGKIVFAEHGLAPDAAIQRWQRRIDPMWKLIGGGCHLTRKTDRLLRDAGFRIEGLQTGHIPGPKFATFMYRGIATMH